MLGKLLLYVSTKFRLEVGDQIKLSGGYEIPPPWLGSTKSRNGKVVSFIQSPYQGKTDAVVKLDEQLSFESIFGDILILTLRFTDAV